MFSEPSLGEEPASLCRPGMPGVGKSARKAAGPADVGALHQHIQDLKAQLLNANKVIQSLQRRARSVSITSGYTSSAEHPPPGPVALASPSHSLTDEDEGWQSDGCGTLCPPALRTHRDLQHLMRRVALLEAQLPVAKPGGGLQKELQSATWPGYGGGDRGRAGGCRDLQGLPKAMASCCVGSWGICTVGHGGQCAASPRAPHLCRALRRGGWQPCGPLLAHPPRKYDSLIQAQARELCQLRQTLQEGRGVSRILAQHLRDALQSFEELLRGTDIDYYLGQGFREQLAQSRQLAKRLSDKLGISKYLLGGHWGWS